VRGHGGGVHNLQEAEMPFTETFVLSALMLTMALAIGAGLPLLANMFERRGLAAEGHLPTSR
jgi:uncharacterized membrane protein